MIMLQDNWRSDKARAENMVSVSKSYAFVAGSFGLLVPNWLSPFAQWHHIWDLRPDG